MDQDNGKTGNNVEAYRREGDRRVADLGPAARRGGPDTTASGRFLRAVEQGERDQTLMRRLTAEALDELVRYQ